MSEIDKSGKDCAEFRVLFDRLADGDKSVSSDERKRYEAHDGSCKSCEAWQRQSKDLMDMMAAMPQFDVSEALTQRILSSVETEKGKVISLESLPAMPLGIVAAAAVILLFPVDGVQGALSWMAAAAGLVLLQVLVKTTSASEVTG